MWVDVVYEKGSLYILNSFPFNGGRISMLVKKLESNFYNIIFDQNLVRKWDTKMCSFYRLMSTIGLYSFHLPSTTLFLSILLSLFLLVALSHIHLRVIFATISKIVYILELSFAFHLSWRNNFVKLALLHFTHFWIKRILQIWDKKWQISF